MGLLAGKSAKAKLGLCLGARAMAGDQMAEVAGATALAELVELAHCRAAVRVGKASKVFRMNGR
jgi:hypothetical protein